MTCFLLVAEESVNREADRVGEADGTDLALVERFADDVEKAEAGSETHARLQLRLAARLVDKKIVEIVG